MDSDDEGKAFTCNICNKSFKTTNGLRLHETRKHIKAKAGEHVCKICGTTLASISSLKIHIRLHTGDRPYTCNACGRAFRTSSGLQRHEVTHTDDKPYQCTFCDKAFKTAPNLNHHAKIHRGKGEEPITEPTSLQQWTCDSCKFEFASQKALNVHMAVHVADRPYECELCCKTFRTPYHLYRHKSSKGCVKPQCHLCHKQFVSSGMLQEHLKTHVPTPPAFCEICGRKFKQKGNLTAHYKWSHNAY